MPEPQLVITRPELGSHKGLAQFGQSRALQLKSEDQTDIVLQVDRIPGPPSVITAQLARKDNGIGGNAKPVAQILARCGGVTITFEADWQNGTVISLVADSLTISSIAKRVLPWVAFSQPPLVRISATLGLGLIPGRVVLTGPPAQIGTTGGFAPTNTALFAIPTFARSVFFQLLAFSAGQVGFEAFDDPTVLFTQANGGPMTNAQQMARQIPGFWPLLPGSNFVQVDSNSGNPIQVWPVFELAL